MDIEELVNRVCNCWWSSPHMHREVWAGLLAARTAINQCGYKYSSEEYQTLTFLLDILHARKH